MGRKTDQMIENLNQELAERDALVEATVAGAAERGDDLTSSEAETIDSAKTRMVEIRSQLERLEATAELSHEIQNRSRLVNQAIEKAQRGEKEVEYRNVGEFIHDQYWSQVGTGEGKNRARERLETYVRAADHQTTADNLGVIPDPIVGDVVNFVDGARPMVGTLPMRRITQATWHRPKVTQHVSVAKQGVAGAAADEKVELPSQAMTITRLTADATTYGGYVNVSRQNLDFSDPQVFDIIVQDLSTEYAVQTESSTAQSVFTGAGGSTNIGATPTADSIKTGLWTAAGSIFAAVKGQGRLFLALSPDALTTFGPLFDPVNPRDAQSEGFTAGSFAQGVLGSISGIPALMSSGLTGDQAVVYSTAAVEANEQRVGTLSVIEPSVLGVQVAYAGYFTEQIIEANGIHTLPFV